MTLMTVFSFSSLIQVWYLTYLQAKLEASVSIRNIKMNIQHMSQQCYCGDSSWCIPHHRTLIHEYYQLLWLMSVSFFRFSNCQKHIQGTATAHIELGLAPLWLSWVFCEAHDCSVIHRYGQILSLLMASSSSKWAWQASHLIKNVKNVFLQLVCCTRIHSSALRWLFCPNWDSGTHFCILAQVFLNQGSIMRGRDTVGVLSGEPL